MIYERKIRPQLEEFRRMWRQRHPQKPFPKSKSEGLRTKLMADVVMLDLTPEQSRVVHGVVTTLCGVIEVMEHHQAYYQDMAEEIAGKAVQLKDELDAVTRSEAGERGLLDELLQTIH